MAEKMTEREQFYYEKGYNKAIEEAADLARKPNKMEVVAALFGKKLGEEFICKWRYEPFRAKFTESGLWGYKASFDMWDRATSDVLQQLLTGEAVIDDAETD